LTIRNSNLRTSLPACAARGIRRVPCTLRVCGRKKLPFAGYSVVKDHTLRASPSAHLRPSLVGPQSPTPLVRSIYFARSLARLQSPASFAHEKFSKKRALDVTLSGPERGIGPPRRPAPLNAAP